MEPIRGSLMASHTCTMISSREYHRSRPMNWVQKMAMVGRWHRDYFRNIPRQMAQITAHLLSRPLFSPQKPQ